MHAMNTQRSIKYRGISILLGCAIAFPGGTMVLGIGALAETGVATDDPQQITLTIDDIRAFQHRMFNDALGVDEPVKLNVTADEMLFLEQNLFLPGDTDAASRADERHLERSRLQRSTSPLTTGNRSR